MIPEILNIGRTSVDWFELAGSVKNFLGISLSASTDRSSVKFSDDASYLLSLVTTSEKVDTNNLLSTLSTAPVKYLRLLHYTFLVVLSYPTLLKLYEVTDLTVIQLGKDSDENCMCVMVGTLNNWKDNIEYILTNPAASYGTDVVALLNKFLVYFESIGLSALWQNYRKERINVTGVFKLLRKE